MARGLIARDPTATKYSITIIDKAEHFEDVSEAFRTVVEPDHFDGTSHKFSEGLSGFKTIHAGFCSKQLAEYGNIAYKHAMLKSVNTSSNQVEITTP